METQDPSGQRLRWWTQETANSTTPTPQPKTPKARWYDGPLEQTVTPPPVIQKLAPPAPMELWEELEAEAVQRAQLEAGSVTFAGSARHIVATTRKRWAYTVLPAILFCTAIMLGTHSWALLPMIGFLIAEILLLDWMVRSIYKKGSPRVSFSPLGMTLQMPAYTLGPVFWDEIKSVKLRRFVFGSYVEVTLKDHKATYARALHGQAKGSKNQTWLIQRSKTLTLMDTMFNTPAQDLAAQIARFRPDLLQGKPRK